jgi:hypothetical protein
MPDLVPKILRGVMVEFWDDVPDEPAATCPTHGLAKDRCGRTACLRPGCVRDTLKTSTGGPAARSRHSWCWLEALAVLRGPALVAMFNDPKTAFQPASSP